MSSAVESGGIVGESLVERQRKRLETAGEYVTRAKVGWFAIFPEKLERLERQAAGTGREGPNLIVYRTDRGVERDHYVIPRSVFRPLATTKTLAPTGINGATRWNFVLRDDVLGVTHGDSTVSVSAFRGALLVLEDANALAEATADGKEFDRRVRALRGQLVRPVGNLMPRRVEAVTGTVFERRPDVKAWVLRAAAGICESCRAPAPFLTIDGDPFLELHHVHRLADGGPDTVENAVAVCPNCHRLLHHGADGSTRRQALYAQVERLRPPTT